ncbi:DNA methyltransferase [Photorhabdus heterorhabditis]|uniref:site-specific DNA-methyltransferase (adenine-specific) n=1 Tax=Photorhabdus heterorhabditis TaxID=880156 RepID=A0ABR5KHX6_9GAMM|nr:DNA methyltransferase [Photorhabdus heterorhabditis]KOY64014.1 hypothetical protein AM629_00855 [Photorhabdus heterorhabditis]MBS9440437.1 hypothetical protein [Photorhabdus heterorhabditis]
MKLADILEDIQPQHDYPAGLIHPYWARKPINVIELLIEQFSNEGDLILDPFMGSGTSVFGALKRRRRIIGSDLNPLACLLVNAILGSAKNITERKEEFLSAYNVLAEYAIALYNIGNNECVERETYEVKGQYSNGEFELKLFSHKIKPINNRSLKGKSRECRSAHYYYSPSASSVSEPLDFSNIEFTENTRIAVHSGVNASHFFTRRNIDFINYALRYIQQPSISSDTKELLTIFLSSLLPMLRLSDKKASSQWPYWRPKQTLTSRNPIVALHRRKRAFLDMFEWVSQEIHKPEDASIFQLPASVVNSMITQPVDLILTDPPYADHAPYLEYSELFWSIVSGKTTRSLWKHEIVKTNAVGRGSDSEQYEDRMRETLISTLESLKNGGYFIFFYVDKNLNHWNTIKSAIKAASCVVEEVVPICKQRRSMKTVTSPGRTLDGDLIIVCKKKLNDGIELPLLTMQDILDTLPKDVSYFNKFSNFMKMYLQSNIVDLDCWNIKDISRII